MSKFLGRRQFMKTTAVGAMAAAPAVHAAALGSSGKAVAPSDQVVLGVIGLGRQGRYNMQKFLEHPQCRVAALCDVYGPHLEEGAKIAGSGEKYTDFRKLLERKDIDAVIISTPDHWHPLQTIAACQAEKDVYVEKPISITVAEGRAMVDACTKYKRVIQVGTMQRSGVHFQKAVDLVHRGEIGRITAVRTWMLSNETPDGWGNPPDSDPPAELDWDLWLGPAPKVPFNSNRFGVHPDRWSTFRYFWDYAGGMMTDWGVHLLDIVQWAMKVDGPEKVSAGGAKFELKDNRETPDTLMVTLKYPDFVCTFENRACNGRTINEHRYGIEFYGTNGSLFVDRSGFQVLPETRRAGDRNFQRMYAMQAEASNDANHAHVKNFLECMQTRKKPICDIETGHYSTATCLLANIAYRTGRGFDYDVKAETIQGDPEASKLLSSDYRAPWKLEI